MPTWLPAATLTTVGTLFAALLVIYVRRVLVRRPCGGHHPHTLFQTARGEYALLCLTDAHINKARVIVRTWRRNNGLDSTTHPLPELPERVTRA